MKHDATVKVTVRDLVPAMIAANGANGWAEASFFEGKDGISGGLASGCGVTLKACWDKVRGL